MLGQWLGQAVQDWDAKYQHRQPPTSIPNPPPFQTHLHPEPIFSPGLLCVQGKPVGLPAGSSMAFTPFRHEKGHLIQPVGSIRLQAWLLAVPVAEAGEQEDPGAHNFLFFFSFIPFSLKSEQEREVEKLLQSKFPCFVSLKLNLENIEAVWQKSCFRAFSSCLLRVKRENLR